MADNRTGTSKQTWGIPAKILLSILLGLAGFLVNFARLNLSHEVAPGLGEATSFFFGTAFPLLAALAWGWRYGLLAATVGLGCQTGWFLIPGGYEKFALIPAATLWVVWHGWCASHRRGRRWMSPYIVEIPFRAIEIAWLYVAYRWLATMNPPFWNPLVAWKTIPLDVVDMVVIKEILNGYCVILAADVLLHLQWVRRLFRLPIKDSDSEAVNVIAIAFLIGAIFWTLDNVMDAVFFRQAASSVARVGEAPTPTYAVYVRATIFFMCLLNAMLIVRYLRLIRQKEKDLRRSDQQLAITLQSIGDAVIATDARQCIQYINPVAEQLTGWKLDEALGVELRAVFKIVNEDTRKPVENPAEIVLAKGIVVGLANHTVLIAKDGTERPIADSGAPIRDEDGKIIGVVLVFRDVAEERRTQRALRDSEQRYRALFNHANDAIFVAETKPDGTVGQFLEVNDITCRRLGYTRKEMLQMSPVQIHHPETMACLPEIWGHLVEHGHVVFETIHVAKQGSPIPVEISAHLFDYDDRTLILAIARDITERKIALAALTESEAKFRELFNNMANGVALYEAVDGGADFIFRDINHAGEKISRATRDQIVGRRLTELFPGVAESGLLDVLAQVYRDGELRHHPLTLYRDDRLSQWVENHVFRLPTGHVVAVYADITERKQAEDNLRKAYQELAELERIINHSPTLVFLRRAEDSFPVEFVTGNVRNLGYQPEEFLQGNLTLTHLLHPDDRDRALKRLREAISTNKDQCSREYRVLSKTGEIHWIDDRTYIRRDATGKATHIQGILVDITEQKLFQEHLNQAEKIQAIGQLAGGVAHDFNNQLVGIMGYGELLRDSLEDPKLRGHADMILRAAKRSADLTAQLLAFARKGKFRSQPVNIHRTITEVVALLEHSVDKRIRIHQDLRANPSITVGDPTQLQNALLNIAINARDAMPEGGDLTFSTEIVNLDEDYCARHPYEIVAGRYLRINIWDTGIGMTEEVRQRIFEPFFTTKQEGRGIGMGLAAVYGTVRNHRGSIHVYSEPGCGSTFQIYLPLDESASASKPLAPERKLIHGTARILVVDDEETVREVVAEMLRRLGYTVTICKSGAEAVEFYRENGDAVDLVVLDMIMPDMSGGDTYRALRQINPTVRVMLASGYGLNSQVQSLLDEGIQGFVQKPFQMGELSLKTAQILQGINKIDPADPMLELR